MKTVILQGHLGDKYGEHWTMKARDYKDIFSCIDANYPGFRQDLIDLALAGGDLDIQQGEMFLEAEDLFYPLDTSETIIITPIPAGAKSGGAKIIAAIALVAVAFAVAPVSATFAAGTFGPTMFALLATFGVAANLAMAGLEQLMTPDPSVDDEERDYLFTQAENTVASGNPVPVLLGELIVGGIVISSGVTSGSQTSLSHLSTNPDRANGAEPEFEDGEVGDPAAGEDYSSGGRRNTPVDEINTYVPENDPINNPGNTDRTFVVPDERYLGGDYA